VVQRRAARVGVDGRGVGALLRGGGQTRSNAVKHGQDESDYGLSGDVGPVRANTVEKHPGTSHHLLLRGLAITQSPNQAA
jgi:hypothetical protein